MFSPHERIYNTPDVSVPAAVAIFQQLRLERVLKRFGYLTCGKPIPQNDFDVAPPLVTLGPPVPTRRLRPFGAHEAFTGWQRSTNVQIPKPTFCPKVPKSVIPGASVNHTYMLNKKETDGRKKHEVYLPKYKITDEIKKPDIFKPFKPLKSPHKLPTIQKDRGKQNESNLQTTDIYKQNQQKKCRNTELNKPPVDANNKRKKKRKSRLEFMKWEASQEKYLDKSVTDLYDYVRSRDGSLHVNNRTEQKYREHTGTRNKRDVNQRMDSFGVSGKMSTDTAQRIVLPVFDIEFEDEKARKKYVFKT